MLYKMFNIIRLVTQPQYYIIKYINLFSFKLMIYYKLIDLNYYYFILVIDNRKINKIKFFIKYK